MSSELSLLPTPSCFHTTEFCEFRQAQGESSGPVIYFGSVQLYKGCSPRARGNPSVTSQAGSPGCDNNFGSLCSHQSSGCRGEWRALRQPGSLRVCAKATWIQLLYAESVGSGFGCYAIHSCCPEASPSSLRYPVGGISTEHSYCHLSCTPGPLGTSLSSSYLQYAYSPLWTEQK